MSEQRTSEQDDRDPDELLPGTRPDDTLDDVGVPVGHADEDARQSGADVD